MRIMARVVDEMEIILWLKCQGLGYVARRTGKLDEIGTQMILERM